MNLFLQCLEKNTGLVISNYEGCAVNTPVIDDHKKLKHFTD